MECPKCGKTEIVSNKKGFSAGKAIAGAVALGGVGIAAGAHGSGKVILTCINCGFDWKAGEHEKAKRKLDLQNGIIPNTAPDEGFLEGNFYGGKSEYSAGSRLEKAPPKKVGFFRQLVSAVFWLAVIGAALYYTRGIWF